MRFRLVGALYAIAAACPAPAAATPFTLDLLLGLEAFGRIAIDPSGDVAVFEERRARGDLPRYDLQPEGALKYARLYRLDLDGGLRVRPLLTMEADAGYTLGPFSPSGRRLALFRLQGLAYRLGVMDLPSGAVRWTTVSPELPAWGRSVEWLSDDTLVAIGTPDGGLPSRLARTNAVQTTLPAQWARAARGEAAYVSAGLGDSNVEPEMKRLWKIDAVTGDASSLAEGAFLDLEVSPTGRHVALLQDGRLLPPPDARTATELRRARSLRFVDLASGAATEPVGAHDISTALLAWSPSGEQLLVATLDSVPSRLLVVSPDGQVRDATPSGIEPDVSVDVFGSPSAQAGWIGDRPVVRGRFNGLQGWFANTDEGTVRLDGVDADSRLVAQGMTALLFSSGGQVVRIGLDHQPRTLGRSASVSRPDGPFGQRALTSPMKARDAVVAGLDGELCPVDADDAPRRICVPASPGSAVGWDRRVSLGTGVADRDANVLTLRRADTVTALRRLNPELDTVALSTPYLVEGAGDVRGWLYLPPAPSTTPPPVVVLPYPGRVNPTPPRKMRPETLDLTQSGQILTAAGYAVLFPDLPPAAEPSERLADRILAVVDAAAAQGLVDPDRIGLWGHSFGAWGSAMSAAQSPRFEAVVALNGSYSFASVIADMPDVARIAGDNDAAVTGSARWLETGQASMLQPYWSDPDRYRRNSPFEAADRITAPILLIHGDLDFGPTQSEQMYAALHRLGRPAALTLLFGEDHGVHTPGNVRIYYQQMLDWFDRYLRPTSPQGVPASGVPRPPSAPD